MEKLSKLSSKLLIFVCVLSLVGAFAFVGCSSEEEESSSGNTENEQSENESNEENNGTEESDELVELQIFAANSLSEALDEVEGLYTEQKDVTFADTQYEASGTLVEMLGAGAYADALITASKSTMDDAAEDGYVDDSTRFDMFTNDLVIVAAEDSDYSDITLEDLATGDYTLAVGDDNVPAGNYAKQALSTTDPECWIDSEGKKGSESTGKDGTFEGTPLEGKVTEGSSVGNVCSYASSGEVDFAIVYSSDVYRIGGVKIVGTIPEDTHKEILYPAAVCSDSDHEKETSEFLEWAHTDNDAKEIWQKWGFELA